MDKPIFEGIATALITPYTQDGIDYEAFAKLIDWQIESGINGLVVCGTTGESTTMTDDEHRDAIDFAVRQAAGRVPVIAGAGSNDTAYALDLARCSCRSGADAILVVTPYYNKATQLGLEKMYTQIADASDVPVILYNVPSRTGVNIEPTTYRALADHDNIVAIKEANGDIAKITETMSYVHGKLDLDSGNDDQIVPLMALGGLGAISVLSNIMPSPTVEICKKFFAGDIKGAALLQYKYHAIIDALFSEVNPIPVKSAMAKMGWCENFLRLPLTPMSADKEATMFDEMKKLDLI